MALKPETKYWIAIALTTINVVGGAFAAGSGEPMHASTHAVLTVVFALWAVRLRQNLGANQAENQLEGRLEEIEIELGNLRQELSDAHERLDFAERVLAQRPDQHRVEQPRQEPKP